MTLLRVPILVRLLDAVLMRLPHEEACDVRLPGLARLLDAVLDLAFEPSSRYCISIPAIPLLYSSPHKAYLPVFKTVGRERFGVSTAFGKAF